jgi:hypothetical protein
MISTIEKRKFAIQRDKLINQDLEVMQRKLSIFCELFCQALQEESSDLERQVNKLNYDLFSECLTELQKARGDDRIKLMLQIPNYIENEYSKISNDLMNKIDESLEANRRAK